MRLNHIDLPVTDLQGAAQYLEAGFGFTRLPGPGGDMAILRGEDGFAVVLQQATAASYPPSFHIGFLQSSDAAVHAAYQRLADAGLPMPPAPQVQYGALAFYCHAPGGLIIEVSHRGN